MSAMQLGWLTNHYEQGKITQEEFTSLYARITNSERESVQRPSSKKLNGVTKTNSVARLHPETRRTLARVRTFKQLVRCVNYALVLALISIIYLSAEHYQITGSLPAVSISGLKTLLTQSARKPLPSDIKLAAEYLSQQSNWDEAHINQLSENWQKIGPSARKRYSHEHWFQTLTLVLSLQIVEQRRLAKSGDKHAVQQALLLSKLADQLEKGTA